MTIIPVPPLTLAVRSDLDRIAAVMFWPDDEAMRRKLNRVAWIQEAQDLIRSGTFRIDEADPHALTSFIEAAADAPPLAEVHEWVKPRYSEGCMVGLILCQLLHHDPARRAATLGKAKRRALDALRGKGGRNFDIRHFENVLWPRMRPVAHLWAAWVARAVDMGETAFPCEIATLANFLSLSERMLHSGAELHLTGRRRAGAGNGALLEIGKAWRPSQDIIERLPRA